MSSCTSKPSFWRHEERRRQARNEMDAQARDRKRPSETQRKKRGNVRANQDGGKPAAPQVPAERHLRESLAALLGDFVQLPHRL